LTNGGKGLSRLAAVDLMRGLVIALMSVDHASEVFNAGRVFTDGALFWKPGTPLPEAQFLTRWLTHLCAPTFVLLAGVALAISTEKRRLRGEAESTIGRHIFVRGLLLVVFELFWMSPAMLSPGRFLCQVLYAIGASLMCMSVLRRLSARALLLLGLVLVVGAEALVGVCFALHIEHELPVALVLTGGFFFDKRLIVAYPLVPWLSIMCLGWALGRQLLDWGRDAPRRATRLLGRLGVGLLVVYAVVRGLNGYGNMMLLRDDLSLVHWLHVSKYPPSLTFITLELGLGALVLAALFAVLDKAPTFGRPLAVFGQVSLFYYLLHIHLLELGGALTGLAHKAGLGAAWLAAALVLAALYPACVRYQRFKAAHPTGLARFI
jgi:uncharacterized membrane protein